MAERYVAAPGPGLVRLIRSQGWIMEPRRADQVGVNMALASGIPARCPNCGGSAGIVPVHRRTARSARLLGVELWCECVADVGHRPVAFVSLEEGAE